MVYNISDWVTWGGMVLFSESILLMKIVIIEHKISFTKYEIFKKIKFSLLRNKIKNKKNKK